jgi:hypothetical protein
VRKSFVVVMIVSTILALSIGTALAENKPGDKGNGKGQEKAANKSTAAKGQERQAANKVTTAQSQATDKGAGKSAGKEQDQNTSYVFKGTIAQNGADGSPLEVKVEKANDAARSLVGKTLKFNVSSNTESYLDNADVESSKLDAKLSDLKAGYKVMIQAKAPKNATSFTANLISAESSKSAGTNTASANPSAA